MADQFRRRAAFEARRYGGDAWVFIRELLQNSRDAGAHRVDLDVERRAGFDRIVCRDDGCGMSFEHAARYLFTLYASSKAGERDAAGRFGIGFWSVLRFQPDEVVVRSSSEAAPGWELRLSGDLERIERHGWSRPRGTEIELIRSSRGEDPTEAVWRSVLRDARHLRQRAGDGEILDVRINGRRATAEIELDPPSVEYVQLDRRCVVALATRPKVDLLAHGLRVRTAATLDELVIETKRRSRPAPPSPDELFPQVVLDSRRLRVLMARGDARSDGELRRLVSLGRRGVRRLIRGQLDREAGLGAVGRAVMRVLEPVSSPRQRLAAAGLAAAVLVVAAGLWWTRGTDARTAGRVIADGDVAVTGSTDVGAILAADGAVRYRGPAMAPLDPVPMELDLRYRPPSSKPMLAVLRVVSLDEAGRISQPSEATEITPYDGAVCTDSCLDVELAPNGVSGEIRLPVPTGHVVDPDSVRVAGGPGTLRAASDGGPILVVEGRTGDRVEYRTGPGPKSRRVTTGPWPSPAGAAALLADELSPFAPDDAARRAAEWVGRRVAYDTSLDTVRRHRAAARDGLGFSERCLVVGAGDCDVQNALVAAILHHAGIPVRLAVGFVGSEGRALPGLHAWVEYRARSGSWHWVDASRGVDARTVTSTAPAPEAPAIRATGAAGSDGSVASDSTDGGPAGRSLRPVLGFVLAVAVAGGVIVLRRRARVRAIRWTESPDLDGLLRGALAKPDSFADVPALFSRRVVPVLGDSAISLRRVKNLAGRGRLAVGSGSTDLARRMVEAGGIVIDARRSAGASVASVVGAIDLDRWERSMRRGESHRVFERLRDAATKHGQRWEISLCADDVDDIEVLDGATIGLGHHVRLVAVSAQSDGWQRIVRLDAAAPAAAVLMLADAVVERLGSCQGVDADLVSMLAIDALEERTGIGR
jgi:hypothetical protein